MNERNDERLLGCKPQHLAALVAVSQTGSFRAASERLGYVQSAVSRQIAALEEEAGMRLVERSRGGNEVRLTQAGRLLLGHAEALLARLDVARTDLARLADGEIGALRIGVPQGVGQRLLWAALAKNRRRRISSRIRASEFPSDDPLFDLVERGTLDVALGWLPLESGPFESEHLMRVRWVLAVPAHWSLARAEGRVDVLNLADKPLIASHSRRLGPPLEASLRAAGGKPNVVFRTDIQETVLALVAAGMGAALLPASNVSRTESAIGVLELDGLPLQRDLGLFWHRERQLTPIAEQLRSTLRELCGRLEDEEQHLERPAV